ncbi:MAG: hypothetical protein AAEJ53_06040, partial [Myxococcota bacterium]
GLALRECRHDARVSTDPPRRAGSMPMPVRLTVTQLIALQLDYEQSNAPAQPRTERVSNPSVGWRAR